MTDTTAASRAPASVSSGRDAESVAALAAPLATGAGCTLYDVQWHGGTLAVLVSGVGGQPVDVDALSRLSRSLSAALDAQDHIDGSYVLEVSSPGLERRLRSPEHFAGALGEHVVIRTSGKDRPRQRIVGEIVDADECGVRVRIEQDAGESVSGPEMSTPGLADVVIASDDTVPDDIAVVPFADISKARTQFTWGPTQHRGAQAASPNATHQRGARDERS